MIYQNFYIKQTSLWSSNRFSVAIFIFSWFVLINISISLSRFAAADSCSFDTTVFFVSHICASSNICCIWNLNFFSEFPKILNFIILVVFLAPLKLQKRTNPSIIKIYLYFRIASMKQKLNFPTWWCYFSGQSIKIAFSTTFRELKWRHQVAILNLCFIEASLNFLLNIFCISVSKKKLQNFWVAFIIHYKPVVFGGFFTCDRAGPKLKS